MLRAAADRTIAAAPSFPPPPTSRLGIRDLIKIQ